MFISIGGISICISSLLPRLTHAIRCTTRYVFWTIIGFILGCIPAHGQIEATLKNIYKLAANDGTYGTGSTKTFLHSLKILILNSKCMIHESTLWFLILFVTLSICPFLLITKKYFQSRFLFFFLCTTLGAIACLTSSTLCMLNGSVGVSGRYWIPTHVFLSFLIFEIFNSSSSSIKFKAAFAGGFLIIGVYTGIIDFNSHNAFVAWSREKDSLIQSELSLLKETLRREPRVITIGEPDLNPASFYWWGNSKYAYDKLSPELILSYPRESFILTLSQEIFINRFESDKADIAILRSWLPDGPNLDFILALDKNIFSVSHKVISTPNDNGNFELINGAIYFIRRNKE
jgi:hypothetical protein